MNNKLVVIVLLGGLLTLSCQHDKKDIKKIINEYVREIDKCISLLNE